jgi:hypothetical protein
MIGDCLVKDMAGAKAAVGAVTFWRTEPSLFSKKADSVDVTFTKFETLHQHLRAARTALSAA